MLMFVSQIPHSFGEVPGKASTAGRVYDEPEPYDEWSQVSQGRGRFSDLPSVGSREHALGTCRPCAWLWKPGGCRNAYNCTHCHLCTPEDAKKRRREHSKGGEPPPKAQPPQRERGKRRQEWTWQQAEEQPAPWIENSKPIPPPPTTPSPADAVCGPAAPPAPGTGHNGPPPPEESESRMGSWSRGSERHGTGNCRPCLFQWTASGCKDGQECDFCHLCPPPKVPVPHPVPSMPPSSLPGPLPALPEWQQVNAPAGFRSTEPGHRSEAHYINLAERLVPENQAQGAQTMTPGMISSSVVLGTAPYPNPQPMQPPQQYRTAPTWQPVPSKMKEFRSVQSPMPMGVVDGPPCFDCGNQTHCVCLPGDVGFSERDPSMHLRMPVRRPEPGLTEIAREESGDVGTSGDADLERSLHQLMQTGENTIRSSSSAGQHLSPGQVAHINGNCTPCVELMQSATCSAGQDCSYCHVCLEPPGPAPAASSAPPAPEWQGPEPRRKRNQIQNKVLKKKGGEG
ncbi:GekBS024P [Symbiodinium sp. CCMP2456]|nr:GekBS024P [Symbiodinium sp. CCMP2456]